MVRVADPDPHGSGSTWICSDLRSHIRICRIAGSYFFNIGSSYIFVCKFQGPNPLHNKNLDPDLLQNIKLDPDPL